MRCDDDDVDYVKDIELKKCGYLKPFWTELKKKKKGMVKC